MNDPTPLFRPTWILSRAFCRKWQSLPRILFAVTLLFLLAPRAKADPTLSAAPNPVSVPAGRGSAATTLTRNDEGPEARRPAQRMNSPQKKATSACAD